MRPGVILRIVQCLHAMNHQYGPLASILKAVLRYGKKQFAVDETRPSSLKAVLRYGKKQFAVDETRCDTRELSSAFMQ
ncbi:hypothetical protein S83_008023 [Arachis hypogaea]